MTHTEIVKEKLKEIEGYKSLEDLGESDEGDWEKLIELKANLSGMQTAIKSELKFLEGFGKKFKEKHDNYDYINNRITDLQNAIKLYDEVGI